MAPLASLSEGPRPLGFRLLAMKTAFLGITIALSALAFFLIATGRGDSDVGGEGPTLSRVDTAAARDVAAGMDALASDAAARSLAPERTLLLGDGPQAPREDSVRLQVRILDRRSGLPIAEASLSWAPNGEPDEDQGASWNGVTLEDYRTRPRGRWAVTGSDGLAVLELKPRSTQTVEAAGYVDGKFEVPAEWLSVEGEGSEKGVEPQLQQILLNEYAALFGTIGGLGEPIPKGTHVVVELPSQGLLQVLELRVPVQPDGTWLVDSIGIAHGEPFAEELGVFVSHGPSVRPLGRGLTLQPGDRKEVHDLAGAKPPWKLNVVYRDGSSMGPGAEVLLRDVGATKDGYVWRGSTDAQGQVQVLGVGEGVFAVHVSMTGSREFIGELRRAGEAEEQDLVLFGFGRVAGRVRWNIERPVGGGDIQLIGLRDTSLGKQPFRDGQFRFDLVPLGARCQLIIPVLPGRAGGRWSGNRGSLGDPPLRELTAAEVGKIRSMRCRPFAKDVTPGLEDIEFLVEVPK